MNTALYNNGSPIAISEEYIGEKSIVTTTSAAYKNCVRPFLKGHQYRITLEDYPSPTANVDVNAYPSKDDTSVKSIVCYLKKGQSFVFLPLQDFEMIRWGASGASRMVVEELNPSIRHTFHCGDGHEFSKLTDAITAAEKWMDSIVYVEQGIYDLVEEFGSDFFASYSGGGQPGIQLRNRVHVIFSPNSKVLCHYQGDNEKILVDFSPFNTNTHGFIIENLDIECSRVRYAVHDERNGGVEYCISHYKNCKMNLDNTNNHKWSGSTCIGGGLGSNHSVRVEGCIFKSVESQRAAVYYHNSNSASNPNYRSVVEICGNYCVNGTVMIDDSRRDATLPTRYLVHDNSFTRVSNADANGMVTEGKSNPLTEVFAWNNSVRQ